MKKITSILVAVLLCMSLSVTVFAKGMDNFEAAKEYTGFSDVAEAAWYHGSVKAAFEYGLIKGASPTEFKPDGTLTVAEAIVMADRIHMLYETGEDTLVNGTPWYQTYVDYAIENDIIEDGDFADYNRNITRGEMADIFTRALHEKEYEEINEVSDDLELDIAGHKHEDSIRTLFRAGIVTGNDPYGTYTPDASIKRCEAAAIISRIVDENLRKRIELLVDIDQLIPNLTVPVVGVSDCMYTYDLDEETEELLGEALYSLHEYGSSISTIDYYAVEGYESARTMLDIPAEEMIKVIFASGKADVKTSTVYFGSIPAYRFEYTMEENGDIIYGYYYLFIRDGYTYATMCFANMYDDAAHNKVALQTLADMANNFKAFGNKVNVKFVPNYVK